MSLQLKFESITQQYVEAFLRKHGFFEEENGEYVEYDWVVGEVGGILCLADYFINYDDIRRDIDNCIPKTEFLEWYYFCLEGDTKINYKNWLKR